MEFLNQTLAHLEQALKAAKQRHDDAHTARYAAEREEEESRAALDDLERLRQDFRDYVRSATEEGGAL